MRVLGFDISTVATGWCTTEDGKYIRSGVIRPIDDVAAAQKITKKAAGEMFESELSKFTYITTACELVINGEQPDVVVVEDSFMKLNASVLRLLARLSGGVLHGWMRHAFMQKISVESKTFIVMANRARATVGCKGNAKKEEVKAFIQYKYDITIADDNEADALILSLYGYAQTISPRMPQARRARKSRRIQ